MFTKTRISVSQVPQAQKNSDVVSGTFTRRFLKSFMATVGLAALCIGCAQNNKPAAGPTADRSAAFWPPYPDEPRIQFLASYQTSQDVQPPKGKFEELVYGKEPEQTLTLTKPYGVRMWNGRIYVCDIRNNSVTALDLKKHQVFVLGKTLTDVLQTPTDIAIAEDGVKYVTDTGRGTVAVYDAQDRRVSTFARKDMKPVAAAVYKDELYVCDYENKNVVVFNRRTGDVKRTIGAAGGELGQFVRPLAVAVDKQGFVYVMDIMKCQLQKFDQQGKLVSAFGTNTARAGGFVRPKHIAVDSTGTIYVVDAAFQNVQLFDQMGHVLTFFGSAGAHPGAMYLPVGICIDEQDVDLFKDKIHPAFQAERLVLVTNQFGPNKVSVYAMGHLREGKTVRDIAASKGLVPTGTDDTKGPAVPTTLPGEVTTLPSEAAGPTTTRTTEAAK